jgi:hypothetical protein
MQDAARELDEEHVEGAEGDTVRTEEDDEEPCVRIVAQHRNAAPDRGFLVALGGARADCVSERGDAPTTHAPPITANTIAGELTARMTPATTGATRMLRPSTQPDATFVAASSFGVRARPGANEAWIGLVSVNAIAGPARSG